MFFLASKPAQDYLKSQTVKNAQPKLALVRIQSIPVPVPPLAEQRRIAAVLSAVQRAIERQERLIALTAELKKSLMHKLFTEGTRGEPLKQTEIGPVPASWEVLRFGESAEFKNGTNFTASQKETNGILTVDVLNMYGEGCDVSLDKLYRVNKQLAEAYFLRAGDLLFVRSSVKLEGVGWASMFTESVEPVTYCGFIIRARLSSASEGAATFIGIRMLGLADGSRAFLSAPFERDAFRMLTRID
jgi:type I restriction enzyme S subunit